MTPALWHLAFYLLLAVLGALVTKSAAFWVLFRREGERKRKNRWALCILLLPFLGGLVYLARCLCLAAITSSEKGRGVGR